MVNEEEEKKNSEDQINLVSDSIGGDHSYQKSEELVPKINKKGS